MLNRYVKVEGHNNWFLVLESNDTEPLNLSETMQEKIIRTEVNTIHNKDTKLDFEKRLILAATYDLDYEKLAKKYGTLLIRPSGTYMTLHKNVITDETYDTDFPINEFAEIVICENDSKAEYKWIEYLKSRFPGQKIVTINFFDLRSESDIEKYFNNAKFITFSTTFSNFEWFEKLIKYVKPQHKIIGYCHNKNKWDDVKMITNIDIEIVNDKNIF